MKVFLCAFNGFSLAIPMEYISSLSIYSGSPSVENHKENNNIYISLFSLFNLSGSDLRHSILLKNDLTGNNIFLISAKVESEAEIPEEKIYPIPKIFNTQRFSVFFDGIQFTDSFPVLVLNIKQLIQYIQKEIVL